MQSTAQNVTTYLQDVPQERQECLTALRTLCLATLTGYEEGMEYGMPCYKKNGVVGVAFASQKNHIALYILKASVVNANKSSLDGLNVGKSCIRYPKPDKVNLDVVRKLLLDTVASASAPC